MRNIVLQLITKDQYFFYRFNDEVKHIKVVEKDSWIHITEAKKFESLLVSHIFKPTVDQLLDVIEENKNM